MRTWPLRALLHALALAAALLMAGPLLLMLMNSFKSGAELSQGSFLAWPQAFSGSAWREAWALLRGSFASSLMLAVPAVLLSSLLAALNGFVLCKYRFRGEQWVSLLLIVAFFLPVKVYLLPLAISMAKLGLSKSLGLLIAIHVIYSLPWPCSSATISWASRTSCCRPRGWTARASGPCSRAWCCRSHDPSLWW